MEPLSANDPRTMGEFRLVARLGAGGMGQVYLGFSPAGHAVAIKVIHPQFASNAEFLRRFSHEVAAARAVGGMYTAPVVDSDLASETPWLATAYVPGPTLSAFIGKHGAFPEAALWRLAAGLAEALRAVHAKGLIHRDLKPANVLLADNGPHVIDFGISRAASSMTQQLTSAGMAIGTPGYMSPEQAQVQPVGPPSDLFSLGCVLAYAATGAPPFDGSNPASILFRIVSAEPDLSSVPPAFRQVIQACLKKNPADRPAPGQLIAMINRVGPATPATLGSFWPGTVARMIAAEQAAQTPAGLAPSGPFAGATTSPKGTDRLAGMTAPSASAGLVSPGSPPLERAPTALAGPSSDAASTAGHAPMIADGYYAAAQQPSRQVPPGPPSAGYTPPGQPSLRPNPVGQAPPGPGVPHPGQAPKYGVQPSYSPKPRPFPAQRPLPGQRHPGEQPGGNAMPTYTPGRRKPTSAEVPQPVHNAIRLMYTGFAVTVLDFVLSVITIGRYDHYAGRDTLLGRTAAAARENSMAGSMAIGIFADFLGLVCWVWLAAAARRGHGWPRTAGTVLLGIYSIVTLFVVFGTKNDPGAEFTTVLVWVLGLASLIPLWTQQARAFFLTWRKR